MEIKFGEIFLLFGFMIVYTWEVGSDFWSVDFWKICSNFIFISNIILICKKSICFTLLRWRYESFPEPWILFYQFPINFPNQELKTSFVGTVLVHWRIFNLLYLMGPRLHGEGHDYLAFWKRIVGSNRFEFGCEWMGTSVESKEDSSRFMGRYESNKHFCLENARWIQMLRSLFVKTCQQGTCLLLFV